MAVCRQASLASVGQISIYLYLSVYLPDLGVISERRAERVWNTLSLSTFNIYAIYAIAKAERSGGYR